MIRPVCSGRGGMLAGVCRGRARRACRRRLWWYRHAGAKRAVDDAPVVELASPSAGRGGRALSHRDLLAVAGGFLPDVSAIRPGTATVPQNDETMGEVG